MDIQYFEYEDQPARLEGGRVFLVTADGDKPVDGIAHFLDEAQPISKDRYDELRARRDGAGKLNTAFLDDLMADPEKYRKKWDDEALAKNPKLTRAQLDASWAQLVHQFGL